MSSVSLSIVKGQDLSPDEITQGTDAPATGDLEVTINLIPANSVAPFTKEEVAIALMKIAELVLDGRYTALKSV